MTVHPEIYASRLKQRIDELQCLTTKLEAEKAALSAAVSVATTVLEEAEKVIGVMIHAPGSAVVTDMARNWQRKYGKREMTDRDRPGLKELIRKAVAAYAALSPEDKAKHDEAQRQSWLRGMAPCEHGVADWETCPDCRKGTSNDNHD